MPGVPCCGGAVTRLTFLQRSLFGQILRAIVVFMGGLKTIRVMAIALALPAAFPACADETLLTLRTFADCAGRYTAMTEHLWLFDGAASDSTAARRDAFADLVAVLLPDAGVPATLVRGWRVEARAAQGALLSAATFRRDARAGVVAQSWIIRCDRLLPGA
jgi:hypothetical protein